MYRFLFLLAALVPSLAFADMSLMPNGSDVTVKYFLNVIFGGLTNLGGGADPIAAVLGKFNAVVLFVGAILLGYTLVAGTMQTAHDGEVLGKKWSSMWVPIRTSLGIAAIVPVGSGYCVIQYVVMWLVLQGVGAANLVWSAYASANNSLPELSLSHNFDKVNRIAEVVLKQRVCTVVINSEIDRAKKSAAAAGFKNELVEPYGKMSVDAMGNPTVIDGFENQTCGSYQFPLSTKASAHQASSWFSDTFKRASFNNKIGTAHQAAFTVLQNDLLVVAEDMYKKGYVGGITNESMSLKYGEAVNKYNKSISDAVKGALASSSNTNEVAQNATTDGWGMAGAWYMKYAYMEQALNQEIQKYPIVFAPSEDAIPMEFKEVWNGQKMAINGMLKNSKYKNEFGIEKQVRSDQGNKDTSTWLEDKLRNLFDFRDGMNKYILDVEGKNPILAVSDLGNFLFNGAVAGELGLAAVAYAAPSGGAAQVLGTGGSVQLGGPTAALLAISPLMSVVLGALIASSAVMAFYLPVAPFILWFGVVVGWLIMVVEAVIAAPMWAISHVHPDGDGVVGRAGQGYSLILGLVLRPALAILGLIASMVLITPVGDLFNKTYWAAFELSNDSSHGLFIGAASVTIFTVIYIALIHKMFSLIHIIPDQILQWMGGPSSNLGQTANALGEAGGKNAGIIGGVVGGVGGNAMRGVQDVRQRNTSLAQTHETAMARKAQETGNEIAKQNSAQEGENQYGTGMGTARMKGSDAVRAAMENAAKEGKPSPSSSELADINQAATVEGFNDVHGDENAWQARQDFGDARAKVGLGEPTASEHNKFMRDRNAVEARHPGSFNPETYVNNTLARKSASRAPTAPPTEPVPKSENESETR